MGLDIRLPIGLMFFIIGGLLALFGLLTAGDGETYARIRGVNINLWWCGAMLIFGAAMFFFGRRAMSAGGEQGVHAAADSPEGRRTEEREHRLGLEK